MNPVEMKKNYVPIEELARVLGTPVDAIRQWRDVAFDGPAKASISAESLLDKFLTAASVETQQIPGLTSENKPFEVKLPAWQPPVATWGLLLEYVSNERHSEYNAKVDALKVQQPAINAR